MDIVDSLLIVSWNIQFGVAVGEAARVIEQHPGLQSLDVLLAQELDDDSARLLARALGMDHVFVSSGHHAQTGRPFGNAVFSRHGLRRSWTVELPGRAPLAGHPRLATGALVETSGGTCAVYSAHTETPALPLRYRRRQFREIASAAGAEEVPVVVGGDFNTVTTRGRRALIADLGGAGLEPLIPAERRRATCFRNGVGFVLDHFFGREVLVVDAGTVDGRVASDHDPIWVRCLLTKGEK